MLKKVLGKTAIFLLVFVVLTCFGVFGVLFWGMDDPAPAIGVLGAVKIILSPAILGAFLFAKYPPKFPDDETESRHDWDI